MAKPLEPRGPLPARVYWTRRLLVLGVALVLVVVIAKVLGGGSDASSGDDGQATQMSAGEAEPAPEETVTAPKKERAESPATRPERSGKAKKPARPDGPCQDSDVLAVPKVGTAEAGRDVEITVRLRNRASEACTWTVSSDTLAVTITSGTDEIWSSRQCPRAVRTEDVVLRRGSTTPVEVVWNARRSDEDCSTFTDWAMMGYYHVETAALAGEASDVQFQLVRPVRGTVTTTVTPKPRPKKPETPTKPKKQDESTGHRAGDDGGGNSDG